jgi:hypothetical protein
VSLLKAFGNLVNVVSEAIAEDQFDDFIKDLQVYQLGKGIAKTLEKGSHASRCKQLIRSSSDRGDKGLDLLWEVLANNVDPSLTIWPGLEKAFQDYLNAWREDNPDNPPDLTRAREDCIAHGKSLRTRLQSLADRHSQLDSQRLQVAIARAMKQAYPDELFAKKFPSVFAAGPIVDWTDLLQRTASDPFELEELFLDALEGVLSRPAAAQASSSTNALSSLIVMVLEPTNNPPGESCEKYAFRAFFCPHENASPDQWLIVDAKDPGYPITAGDFVNKLQSLLLNALACALKQIPDALEPMLIEIFLPKKFLNMDLGTIITLPGQEDEPLANYYPIVLRSSDRYQNWHEQRQPYVQNTLPAKWDWARRYPSSTEVPCCWWQDPPRKDSIKMQIKRLHDLRVEKRFFSFRRLTNLPRSSPMREAWLNQVINACPAVAIWWRSGARSRQAEREQALRFCHDDHAQSGVDQPAESALAHEDPFLHPHVTSPLRLFHAMATAVFHGRRSAEHGRALSEVVVLMESVERWPPRRDLEPVIERRSDQRGTSITVDREGAAYQD